MSETTPSTPSSPQPTTRVDSAHHPILTDTPHPEMPKSNEPSMELLAAIAGRDPMQAGHQSQEQALELANILQDKQRLLDQRESELNARSAMLENDLRHSRMTRLRNDNVGGGPLRGPLEYGVDLSANPHPAQEAGPAENTHAELEAAQVQSAQRWRTETDGLDDEPPLPAADAALETVTAEDSEPSPTRSMSTPDVPDLPDTPGDPPDQATTDDADRDLQAQQQELQQQRDALLQRKQKLDARHAHVEQLYDQVAMLHREALELQISTESIWSDLNQEFPSEELAARLAETRSRLADHYQLMNETLAGRKDELHDLREQLNAQETRLRQQRRELQMWADRRYDEVESRTAQLIRRERELDHMEAEFERQSIQWQHQRETYRQEIERLSWELRSVSAVAAMS